MANSSALQLKSSETRLLKKLYSIDSHFAWQQNSREQIRDDKVSNVFTFITTFILVFNCYNYAFKRFLMQEVENRKTGWNNVIILLFAFAGPGRGGQS